MELEKERAPGVTTSAPLDRTSQREGKVPKMVTQTNLLSKKHFTLEKRILAAIKHAVRFGRVAIFYSLILAALMASKARICKAEPGIDLGKIAMIESGGDPMAVGKNGDRGLYQITPVLLTEYNSRNKSSYTDGDLFNAKIARKIADWYLHKRIPQMIRHFKKKVTVRNVLVAWNAGIRYVVKGGTLPKITTQYLKKYGVAK